MVGQRGRGKKDGRRLVVVDGKGSWYQFTLGRQLSALLILFELQCEPLGLIKLHNSTTCNESLLQVIKPSISSARNGHWPCQLCMKRHPMWVNGPCHLFQSPNSALLVVNRHLSYCNDQVFVDLFDILVVTVNHGTVTVNSNDTCPRRRLC